MDNEKRLALCFALSMLVILLFSWQNVKNAPKRPPAAPSSGTQTPVSGITPDNETIPSAKTPESRQEQTVKTDRDQDTAQPISGWNWLPRKHIEEDRGQVVVESERYRVTFSKTGAYPISWKLLDYPELYKPRRYLKLRSERGTLTQRQQANLELEFYENNQDGNAHPVDAIDPVFPAGRAGLTVSWGFYNSDETIPYECDADNIPIVDTDGTDVRFTYEHEGITLEKIYRFYPDQYHLDFEIRVVNQTGQNLTFNRAGLRDGFYDVKWLGGFGFPSLRRDAQNNSHVYLGGKINTRLNAVSALPGVIEEHFVNKTILPEFDETGTQKRFGNYSSPTFMQTGEPVGWVGVGQKYFLAAIIPQSLTKTALEGLSNPGGDAESVMKPLAGVRMNVDPIIDGGVHSDRYKLYIGPMNEPDLVKVEAGLDDARQIFLRSVVGPISRFMLRFLQGLYSIFPNYGVGIILLTLLVKILMFPMYHKQMASMKKMQALQPQIAALKEKHKNDAQKQQKEQMELFRKHKVNPLGGCLPMLAMLPIFIALYATFGIAVELRGAPFFAWIQDLSAPDGAFYIPIGSYVFTVNILPLAYMVLMLWSTSQQKMEGPNAAMMKLMPVFFVFLFWTIASGVILYFVISIFLDTMQRLMMDKFKKDDPLAPAVKKKP